MTDTGLGALRGQIDELDARLIELLNQRAQISLSIGEIKKILGLPVLVSERENEVLGKLAACNQGPLSNEQVRAIYREIFSASRQLQNNLLCKGP